MFQRFRVDFLGQDQTRVSCFGQSNQFLKPGRACGFEVQSRAGALECAADGSVNGKLITTRMNAQLQCPGQPILFYGERDHRHIVTKLFFEFGDIARIIHTLVKTASELRRDRLDRNTFIGERSQNHEQLRRCLRLVRFIHGNFGNKISRALFLTDAPVNRSRLSDCEQIFLDHFFDLRPINSEGFLNIGYRQFANQFRMLLQKALRVISTCGPADAIRHVDGKKVGVRQKSLHGVEPNMVCVHVVRFPPIQCFDRLIGRRACTGRIRANGDVLTIGFVPNRNDLHALLGCQNERLKLCFCLMSETIANTQRIFAECQKSHGAVHIQTLAV